MTVSLTMRAACAIVLIALFIVLSVAAIVALVALGVLILVAIGEANGGNWVAVAVALACFIAAGVIAWSLVPRIDRFEPPGPEIHEADHPALFAELRHIAKATGEALPTHVYLIWEVNAFVTQRGGVMGLGSKRVMGLGLPLLRILDVSELRAVVAHEMGHFHGGDTRLGPWIYRTRGAIGRTIISLARAAASTANVYAPLHYVFRAALAPFRWFGRAFMRVTQAISRAQELSADRLAAGIVGAAPVIDGLKKTHAGALAHHVYQDQELGPIIDRGRLPPVGAGFEAFMKSPAVTKLLAEVVDDALARGIRDPFDSHPPLRERIEELARFKGPARERDPRPAIALLTDGDAFEQRLVAELVGRTRTDPHLPAIAWEDVGWVWIEHWREVVANVAPFIRDLTIVTIPQRIEELRQLFTAVEDEHTAASLDDSSVRRWARHLLGAALGSAFVDAGFEAVMPVGAPATLRRGDAAVEPFTELAKYLEGKTSPEAWNQQWTALGLADRRLAAL